MFYIIQHTILLKLKQERYPRVEKLSKEDKLCLAFVMHA